MEIIDKGEISKFETMPTEGMLYLTAVCYSGTLWAAGPSGENKAEVMKQLQSYSGITKARIYAVRVPLIALDAA